MYTSTIINPFEVRKPDGICSSRNTEIKTILFIFSFHSFILSLIFSAGFSFILWKSPEKFEQIRNGEREFFMAQHAILRFEKNTPKATEGPAKDRWKPTTNGPKETEQYASNPDIDTSRSAMFRFHIVKGRLAAGQMAYLPLHSKCRIEQAGCRHPAGNSTRFVDTLIKAPPARSFLRKRSPQNTEIQEFFPAGGRLISLIGRVGKENAVCLCVGGGTRTAGRENAPSAFGLCPAGGRGQPPVCQNRRLSGNRANLTKWQDDFHAYMVEKNHIYPTWSVGGKCQQDRPEAYPHPFVQTGGQWPLSNRQEPLKPRFGRHYPARSMPERRKRKPSPC